jgi:hypothetical protein
VPFYTAVAPPTAPAAPTTDAPPPYAAGSSIDVSWVPYTQCPASQALSGYIVTVTNGSASENNPVPSTTTDEQVQVGSTGSTTVTYVAVCGSGTSAVNSDSSQPLSLLIGP